MSVTNNIELRIINGPDWTDLSFFQAFPLHFIIDFSSGACCASVVFSSSEPASERQKKHLCCLGFQVVVDFPSSFVLKERDRKNFLSFEDSVKSFLQSCCGERRRRRRKMQCKEKLLYHTASLKSYPDWLIDYWPTKYIVVSPLYPHTCDLVFSIDSHCLKITQNVAFEFFDYAIFHQFLSY